MRDAKLAALRDGSEPSPRATAPPQQQPGRAVTLAELEGQGGGLARVMRVQHQPPGGRENQPPAMSAERASLLSFIAGEVRTR